MKISSIFVTFLLGSINALYKTPDAAAANVPKIKSDFVYTTKKIAELTKDKRDIYLLKGSCNLSNVYTADWKLVNGKPMKVTVYCKLNYSGEKGVHKNFVRMEIIHYGVNDDKNKFVCEDVLKEPELEALTVD